MAKFCKVAVMHRSWLVGWGSTLMLRTYIALKGLAPYNEGSFYVQESNGDLTWDHYLNSSPINFCSLENSKVLGPGIKPALSSSEAYIAISSNDAK